MQTSGTAPIDNEAKKGEGKGVTAQELKAKQSHGGVTKLKVLEDLKDKDESEDDIEYMPPRAKGSLIFTIQTDLYLLRVELPDLPDDIPHDVNLSMFENGVIQPGFLHHFVTRVGPDGLTFYERKEKEQQRLDEIADRMNEAILIRDFESVPLPCVHRQECPGGECSESIANKKAAELKYQRTIAALSAKAKKPKAISKKLDLTEGPSTLTSKSAATALSQQNDAPSPLKGKSTTKISVPTKTPSIFSRPKKAPQPTNPSPMRHSAASALSKTTIGHSKGRATSAALLQTVLPAKNPSKAAETRKLTPAPAVLGFGGEQRMRFDIAGWLNNEQEFEETGKYTQALDDLLREEAEKDFQLG